MPSVDDSIQFVKGIGPKKAKLLEKLHIRTLRDALETYPRDYEDRTHITPIAEIDMEDKYAVRAVVGTEPKVNRIRSSAWDRSMCSTARCKDSGAAAQWFHRSRRGSHRTLTTRDASCRSIR